MRVAFHGVLGAAFRITVFPVARLWPSLLMVTSKGTFQGTIAQALGERDVEMRAVGQGHR